MSFPTISALLAAILTFVIGWSVLLRDRRQRPYVTFSVLCFNLGAWYLAIFFSATVQSDAATWISIALAAAIPTNAERFWRSFLSDIPRRPKAVSRVVLASTAIVYALLLVSLFYPLYHSLWFTVPVYGFILASLYYCVYLIYSRQRAITSRPEATRLKYLFYGGAATVTLAATDALPRLGIAFPTVGNVLTVIYMYFISQTLVHLRLLDLKELLAKMVTLSALVLILTVVYGLLLAWVGADQTGVFFFNTIVASFVVMVIFEPLRGWLEGRVNRWLFAEKYEFSRRLRQLMRELVNIIQVRPLISRLLTELENSRRVTHVSIYLAAPEGSSYRLAGHVGPAPLPEVDEMTRRVFFERLRETGMLTHEAMERELADQGAEDATVATRNVQQTMAALLADVCIPLVSDNQLLGLLNLRDERLREAYATEELELLRQVAAQAAITLRNSKIYEQMQERDRLAALGQMAAGLAHEIRNPLGAIKGAAQLLDSDGEEEDHRPGENDEYLQIIVEEVDRLDRVVSQFLGYARPYRGDRELLSTNDVVRKTVQLLRSQQGAEPSIVTQLAPELPQVRGDAEQLRQVFLNLSLNALQAMGDSGELRIETRLRRIMRRGRSQRMIEIAFRDRGPGIPADKLSDIFIPFYTTKDQGTGLGLPICQRIVQDHDGQIEVQSESGKGTTFFVLLPTADDAVTTGVQPLPRS